MNGTVIRNTALLTICLALTATGFAQDKTVSKTGTTAAPFLNLPVGARAIAMGGAYVAVADDATSIFWNAAGITRVKNMETVFNHSEWLADINFDFVAVVMSLGEIGKVGLSATVLSMEDMERTTTLFPEGTGETFGAGSYALGVTYARELTDRFSIGGTAKYVNEYILNSSAAGFAIDIGTMFVTQFNDMRIGMNISNFGTKMRMEGRDLLIQYDIDQTSDGNNENINADLKTDEWEMPLMFRFGLAMDVLSGVRANSMTLSLDALHPSDNTESLSFGAEYVFNDLVALRGGYRAMYQRDSEEGFTVGGGLNLAIYGNWKLKLDYAYENFGRLDSIQKYTLALSF